MTTLFCIIADVPMLEREAPTSRADGNPSPKSGSKLGITEFSKTGEMGGVKEDLWEFSSAPGLSSGLALFSLSDACRTSNHSRVHERNRANLESSFQSISPGF